MQLATSIFGGIIALVSTYLIFFRKSKTEKDAAASAPYKIEVPTIETAPAIEPVIEVAVKTRKPRKSKVSVSGETPAVKKPKKAKSTPAQQ